MYYIGNAFSLQMINVGNVGLRTTFEAAELTVGEVKSLLENHQFQSCVGHTDTATVLTNMLEMEIPSNRISVSLTPEDTLIVAQVMGGRLPEGATTLPDDVTMKFIMVHILG